MSRASRLLLVASFACLITLVITRPAFATGGTIETPTSSTVSQPIVISGWAVAFRCPTAPPGPGYECTADGSWYPPGHAFYTAAGTFVGCTGTPPSSPPQVCFWYSPWIAASSSLAIQQAGNPADGTGVDVVEIWTCPGTTCTSSNKVLQGTATYGQPRSDVATLLGSSRFTNSGYSFTLSTLTPGQYVVRVRMHSAIYDNWNTTSKTITVVAATTHPVMGLDALVSNGASVSQPFPFSGWAIDTAAPSGTGVDTVAVNAWHNPGSGQPAFNWAPITLGGSRPAVGSTYGSQFTNSGYTTTVTGYPAGVYYPVAFMRSTLTSMWTLTTSTLYVDATTFALTIDRQGSGTGGVSASGLSCAGGASTQALPCGATYPVNTVVTLTPQADTGSTFLGWAGACSGTGACQLTLSTARLAAAIFSKTPTSSDVSYYHTDAIGSVRAITDAAGATVIRHDYMAFGEDTQPLTGDPMRFGGLELDPESALSYAGARYYRVSWGRFTQVDPVGGSPTNPQRWNRYAYALNNPLRFVDPMGMSAIDSNPCDHDSSPQCMDTEAYQNYLGQVDAWQNGRLPGQMSSMQGSSLQSYESSAERYGELVQSGWQDDGNGNLVITYQSSGPFSPSVSIDSSLSAADTNSAAHGVIGGITRVNATWAMTTPVEQAIIRNVTHVQVIDRDIIVAFVLPNSRSVFVTPGFVKGSSSAFMASTLAHEGQHLADYKAGRPGAPYDPSGRSIPYEQRAYGFQLELGARLGLSSTEMANIQRQMPR